MPECSNKKAELSFSAYIRVKEVKSDWQKYTNNSDVMKKNYFKGKKNPYNIVYKMFSLQKEGQITEILVSLCMVKFTNISNF